MPAIPAAQLEPEDLDELHMRVLHRRVLLKAVAALGRAAPQPSPRPSRPPLPPLPSPERAHPPTWPSDDANVAARAPPVPYNALPRPAPGGAVLWRAGLIADVQYADRDNGQNFAKTLTR